MDADLTSTPRLPEKPPHLFKFPTLFLVLGVIWPAMTVVFELLTRACAREIFDPLPTPWHVAFALTVPVANGLVWWIGNGPPARYRRWISVVRGSAWVSGAIYLLALDFISLLALPMLAFAAVFVFVQPMLALLVVATTGPLMGFLMLVRSAFALRQVSLIADDRAAFFKSHRGARWLGALAAVLAWAAVEAPALITVHLTRSSLDEAQASNPETARTLRKYGDKETLRSIAHRGEGLEFRSSPMSSIVQGGFMLQALSRRFDGGQSTLVREIFYRAYGETYDSRPERRTRPALIDLETLGRPRRDATLGWAWDGQRGGDAIGPKIQGLAMHTSRMDWHVDEPSRLAYGEWTIEFRNQQSNAQEARCQMLLPPRGVVSRLTLWIDGEEREAAFGAKSQVKAAYRQVVQVERRDPVMVNMIGPDLVMTQCFPVPPAGTMKIRLGIIAPLGEETSGALLMPRIIARNFLVPGSLTHALWVQSASAFQTTAGKLSHAQSDGAATWQGAVSHEVLDSLAITWPAMKPSAVMAWTVDPFALGGDRVLVREIVPEKPAAQDTGLVLVVDTSQPMSAWRERIAQCLAKAPAGLAAVVFTAENEAGYTETTPQEAAARAASLPFGGGMDNAPALHRACEIAGTRAGGAVILWAHAPQLFEFGSTALLEQFLERSPQAPAIRSIQLVHGRDLLVEKLYKQANLSAVRAAPGIEEGDLAKLLWSGRDLSGPRFTWSHWAAEPDGADATKVWPHLARYAAFEKVLAEFKGTQRSGQELADFAARYQLVTPVSSAVVLETQQQYQLAGLTPVDPSTTPKIPAVPEPGGAWLLMLTLALATFVRRRPRRA